MWLTSELSSYMLNEVTKEGTLNKSLSIRLKILSLKCFFCSVKDNEKAIKVFFKNLLNKEALRNSLKIKPSPETN